MRHRSVFGAVLLIAALLAGNTSVCAAAARAPRAEMACCKAGHRTCGQMTRASDCCKVGQHEAPSIAAAKQIDAAVVIALPASVPALFALVTDSRLNVPVDGALKRPHDPPHLHTFSLLI
jgi:hypothetical protein